MLVRLRNRWRRAVCSTYGHRLVYDFADTVRGTVVETVYCRRCSAVLRWEEVTIGV